MQGLRLLAETVVAKDRLISTQGTVKVSRGDVVAPDTLVAEGVVENPDIREFKVHDKLGVAPESVRNHLLKTVGDTVELDEAIAVYRGFFSRGTRVCRSPISGTVQSFSDLTGRMMIRGHPLHLKVKAHIPGTVTETYPGTGARVETRAAHLEGLFGVGGETHGMLAVPVNSNESPVTAETVREEHKGKVLVGGSYVTLEAVRKAVKHGVNGLIVGGMDQKDLTELLGYEIGVGVTGGEALGMTLILTEGFGVHPMGAERFSLLESLEGSLACIDGSTQIRSRMQRPEVIVPLAAA